MKIEEEIGDFLKDFESYLRDKIEDPYMLYPLLPAGKRIRPLLLYSASYPERGEKVMSLALAVELVHSASLVHDDLPFVDNSPTRRGKPSVHIKYTPGIAVMIGDALLSEAFYFASRAGAEPVAVLARASGMDGIAGGQILDLKGASNLEEIEKLHYKKTVKLMEAAFLLGLMVSSRKELMERGRQLSRSVGFLFQVVDDILDEKTCGDEPNIVKVIGREKALKLAEMHYNRAVELSEEFEGREIIKWVTRSTMERVSSQG